MGYNLIQKEIDLFRERYKTRRIIEDVLIKEGYEYFEPSNFDDIDRFGPLMSTMGQASMVKFIASDSRILTLNPDNTTSIISRIIPLWQDGMKLKLFYSATASRSDRELGISEIRQVGVERLGESDFQTDEEVILLALDILSQFSIDFVLEVSNSKFVDGLLGETNLSSVEKRRLKGLVYRKDKQGIADFAKGAPLPEPVSDCLLTILNLQGDAEDIKAQGKRFCMNKKMADSIQEITALKKFLDAYGYLDNVSFDLSMIAELDYYDGLMFKGYYPGYFKDALSGGRYDSFTKEYGKKIPAIGFSLDLDQVTNLRIKQKEKEGEDFGLPQNRRSKR